MTSYHRRLLASLIDPPLDPTLVDNTPKLLDLLNKTDRLQKVLAKRDERGFTLLHIAAERNQPESLKCLLIKDAKPNVRSSFGSNEATPLHVAAGHGHLACLQLLVQLGGDIMVQDRRRFTPVDYAQINGQDLCFNFLNEVIAQRQAEERIGVEDVLIQVQNNLAVDNMVTLNHWKQLNELFPLSITTQEPTQMESVIYRHCIIINNRDIVRILGRISKDIPISLHGANLLHAACRYGKTELAHLLTEKVTDILYGITNEGYHSLHIAIVHQHPDIIRLLIQLQIDSFRTGNQPRLCEASTDEQERSLSESLPFSHLKFSDPTISGHTILHFAVATNNNEILRILLKYYRKMRLNVEAAKCGYTALHLAAFLNHTSAARQLLRSGANPNTSLSASSTVQLRNISSSALSEAVINKNLDLLKLLIDFGAEDKGHVGLKICIPSAEHRDFIVPLLGSLVKCDDSIKVSKPARKERGLKSGVAEWASIPLTEVEPLWIAKSLVGCKFFAGQSIQGDKIFDYITTINLTGNRLTWLPREIFQLAGLQVVNASSNQITALPELQQSYNVEKGSYEWPCPNLARINLSKNALVDLSTSVFKFPGLSHLDLSHNHLQSLPLDMWSSPKLYQVNLSFNRLESLPSNWPGILNRYQVHPMEVEAEEEELKQSWSPAGMKRHTIRLTPAKRNSLRQKKCEESLDEPTISKLQDRLNISNSNLPIEWGAEESREEVYDGLAILNLSNNCLCQLPDNLACLCPKLVRLDLSHNHVRSVSVPRQFPSRLKQLCLSHNPLEVLNCQECMTKPLPCTNPLILADMTTFELDNVKFCSHRQHNQLNRLGVLELSHCQLRLVNLYSRNSGQGRRRKKLAPHEGAPEFSAGAQPLSPLRQSQNLEKLVCPLLTRLILSHNSLEQVPDSVCDMVSLNSLDLSHNDIIELPAKLGQLCNLWEFPLDGLSLISPPHNIIERGKTRDIIGFLWSLLQKARPYHRMKLMLIGRAARGKTTLLNRISEKGQRGLQENWALNRMMGVDKQKNLSTVGIVVSDWTYYKRVRESQTSLKSITFMTWDFGGQEEYYATHQCFISKRSLYLLVWNVTHGMAGAEELRPWLLTIQARAPNSPVIIVGTHMDKITTKPQRDSLGRCLEHVAHSYGLEEVQREGFPHVMKIALVSCKSGRGISELRDTIFNVASQVKENTVAGRGIGCGRIPDYRLLMDQLVPASYLQLEDTVRNVALHMRLKGKPPVLSYRDLRDLVFADSRTLISRDSADRELEQAVRFLNDNGTLLHYEDPLLSDFYFVHPQWLCDMLAHIVTVREINPFVKEGVMRTADFSLIFNDDAFPVRWKRVYIRLLTTFEVAVEIGDGELLIPSTLPSKRPNLPCTMFPEEVQMLPPLCHAYIVPFVPSGFWPRLMSRLLSDKSILQLAREGCSIQDRDTEQLSWVKWREGAILQYGNLTLMSVEELQDGLFPTGTGRRGMKIYKEGRWDVVKKNIKIFGVSVTVPDLYPILKYLEHNQTTRSGRRGRNQPSRDRLGHSLSASLLSQPQHRALNSVPEEKSCAGLTASCDCEIPQPVNNYRFNVSTSQGELESHDQETESHDPAESHNHEGSSLDSEARSHDRETKSHDQKSEANDLQTKSHNLKTESRDLETRSLDLKIESHDLETRSQGKETESYDAEVAAEVGVSGCANRVVQIDEIESEVRKLAVKCRSRCRLLSCETNKTSRLLLPEAVPSDNGLALPADAAVPTTIDGSQLESRLNSFEGRLRTISKSSSMSSATEGTVPGQHTGRPNREQSVVNEDKHDQMRAGLASKAVDHISLLIEEWFTGVRPRYHLVPCPHCASSGNHGNRSGCSMERSFSSEADLQSNSSSGGAPRTKFSAPKHSGANVRVESVGGHLRPNSPNSGGNRRAKILPPGQNETDVNSPEGSPTNVTKTQHPTPSHPPHLPTSPKSPSMRFRISKHLSKSLNRTQPKTDPVHRPSRLDSGRPDDGGRNLDPELEQSCDSNPFNYAFRYDDCVVTARSSDHMTCPSHGDIPLKYMAPDTLFLAQGKDILIKTGDYVIEDLIGRGAYATVFKVKLKKQGETECTGSYALKALTKEWNRDRSSSSIAHLSPSSPPPLPSPSYQPSRYSIITGFGNLKKELCLLFPLRNQHIVQMHGVVLCPLGLILELAPAGSLKRTFEAYTDVQQRLTTSVCQAVIVQIASAIQYLHSCSIIYRDLKSDNVLVWKFPDPHTPLAWPPSQIGMETVLVKLSDLGISQFAATQGARGLVGTPGFMAPEILKYHGKEVYTDQVDIFSFGMFIYELLTLHIPYESLTAQQANQANESGARPTLTRKDLPCAMLLRELMVWCWQQNPDHRPSASAIIRAAEMEQFLRLQDGIRISCGGEVTAACICISSPSSSAPFNARYSNFLKTNTRFPTIPLSSIHVGMENPFIEKNLTDELSSSRETGSGVWFSDGDDRHSEHGKKDSESGQKSSGSVMSGKRSSTSDTCDFGSVWMDQDSVKVNQSRSDGGKDEEKDAVRVKVASLVSNHDRSVTPTEKKVRTDQLDHNRDATNTEDTGFGSYRGTEPTQSESSKSERTSTPSRFDHTPNNDRLTIRSAADSGISQTSSFCDLQANDVGKLKGAAERERFRESPKPISLQRQSSLPSSQTFPTRYYLGTPAPYARRSSLSSSPRPLSAPMFQHAPQQQNSGPRKGGGKFRTQRSLSFDGKATHFSNSKMTPLEACSFHSHSKWSQPTRSVLSKKEFERSFYSPGSDSCYRDDEPLFEVWVASNDAHRSILSVVGYNGQFNSLQEIDVGDSPVLSICSVGDKVWVGFEIGFVLIFHCSTHLLFAQAWVRHYTPVVSIVHIPQLRRVFVTLGNGSVMAFSDEVASSSSKDGCKVTLHPVSTYHDLGRSASCALAVPILNQLGNVASHELWVGQSEGMITVLNPNDLSIIKFIANTMDRSETPCYMAYLTYANLVCNVNYSTKELAPVVSTATQLQSNRSGVSVYGALYHGQCLTQWDAKSKDVIACHNCGQSIDKGKECKISSLHYDQFQLFVGLSTGDILILDALTFSLLTNFTCHRSHVKALFTVDLSSLSPDPEFESEWSGAREGMGGGGGGGGGAGRGEKLKLKEESGGVGSSNSRSQSGSNSTDPSPIPMSLAGPRSSSSDQSLSHFSGTTWTGGAKQLFSFGTGFKSYFDGPESKPHVGSGFVLVWELQHWDEIESRL